MAGAGGLVRRSDGRRLHLRWWGSGGVVAAAIGTLLILLPTSRVLQAIGGILVLFGSLAFVTSTLAGLVRRELRRHAETVERELIRTLPPRRVAELLLDRVYGPSIHNRDMVTALLGGAGLAIDGGDLTVSEHTEIDLQLKTVDDQTYEFVIEARYAFKNRVPTSTFVIFATSDLTLRDVIVSGCRLPLFELWFMNADEDIERFQDSVDSMRESARVGIRFADSRGQVHEVRPEDRVGHLGEVKFQDWGRYLSFFRTDLGDAPRLTGSDFLGRLRIFEIDLHALAESAGRIQTVLSLSIRSKTIQLIREGMCYWEAPYPCFIEQLRVDVSEFKRSGGPLDPRYSVKTFSPGLNDSGTVGDSKGILELHPQRWWLPGHGAVVQWQKYSDDDIEPAS